jgi:hypothetical protein
MRHLRALVRKDLSLHGAGIAATQAGAMALLWVLMTLHPASSAEREGLIFNVSLLGDRCPAPPRRPARRPVRTEERAGVVEHHRRPARPGVPAGDSHRSAARVHRLVGRSHGNVQID